MRQTILRTTLILALTLAALPAFAAYEVIPCVVGNKWEYDTVKVMRATVMIDGRPMSEMRDAASGNCVYEVASADPKDANVFNYVESSTTWSTSGGEPDTHKTEIRLTTDAAGLRILSTESDSGPDDKPEKQTYDPGLLYFAREAANGKSWDVGTMRDGESTNTMAARVTGRETVTVPAGTFKDCLRVVYSGDNIAGTMAMWEKQFTLTSGKSRGVYWIADGIGVVKEVEITNSVAETPGPNGKPISIQAGSCTVSELRPGFVVKK